MKIKLFQVDAFADEVFKGNPAAVCPLDNWIDAPIMQKIAQENNLSETTFIVKRDDEYEIRWFTPNTEVDLCGHATLAAAYVLFTHFEDKKKNTIQFYSPRSGNLSVEKTKNDQLVLDFPAQEVVGIQSLEGMYEAIGLTPIKTIKGNTDYLLIYNSQEEIEAIEPNFFALSKIDCRGVIISAPGNEVDFVSRFFAPQSGILEDPVTGSAHTILTPFWAKTLDKNKLTALQLSKRGGYLECEYLGDRVKIAGKAVPYLEGEIEI